MVAVLFDVGAPFLGEVDHLAPCGLLDSDETFGNGLTKSWGETVGSSHAPSLFWPGLHRNGHAKWRSAKFRVEVPPG